MISSHPVLAVVLAVGTAYSVLAAPIASNALPGDQTLESVAPTLSSSSSLPIQTDSTGNSHRSGIPTTIEPVRPQPTAPSTNFGDGSSSTVSENLNSHTSTVQGHKKEAESQLQQLREALKKSKEPMTTAIKEDIQDLENKIPPSHDAQQTVTHSSSKKDDVAMVDAHSTEHLDVHMHGYSHLHSPQSQPDTDMGGVSHGSPMSLDPPSPHQARSVFGSGQPLSTNSHIPSPYRARSLFDLYGDDLD
ncbi:hypothetical protein F5876DRAFT_61627 [Lentinula aff. lateritia]|uniref:Uncharacterized protein n=1 Tax=Lentinula aff. lateritia TaxID=2804960 RepID=A0ACC1UF16_9AGAR|nr:hypothetical protein F5876DRAFT_61627 [Lentinula aff. lateritia]